MCFSAKKKKSSTGSASSSSYKPLKEYQEALGSLPSSYSKQQRTEYEDALKIYTSRTDLNKFSKEEATQVFPALFVVGKSYILNAESFDGGFKWFEHAIMFGEKAEPRTDFAPHYEEMAYFFSDKNKYDQSAKCIDKALEIFNSAKDLDAQTMVAKGRALFTKGSNQRAMNDLNGAAETLAQSVMVLEGLVGSEEAATLLIDILESLANLQYHRKDQEKAHLYSIKGLSIVDKTLGLDNPRGHNLARELACTLLRQKRFDEALTYAKKWENMMAKEHGANDPRMSTCYFLHGQICSDLGDYTEALQKFELAEKASKSNKNFKLEDSGELFYERARCILTWRDTRRPKRVLNKQLNTIKRDLGRTPNNSLIACLVVHSS